MAMSRRKEAPGSAHARGTARRGELAPLCVAAALLLVPALLYTAILGWRLELKQDTESRADAPEQITQSRQDAGEGGGDGAVTAHVEFTSVFAVDENYMASEDFTWDDQWFFADTATYNHELAQACAALTSVANAESEHFMFQKETPDYMLDVLVQLGFEYYSTETYALRSAIVDQLAELIKPAGDDACAYTLASKHITNATTGQSKLLVIAVLRGTYGPEWFSNLKVGVAEGASVAEAQSGQEGGDHTGFSAAAQGLIADVYDFVAEQELPEGSGAEEEEVSLLLCGHSRGGAVANLAASAFDDYFADEKDDDGANKAEIAGGSDDESSCANVDAVYTYTFATPGTTRRACSGEVRYGNIFNICNPADLIPQTPLASWGYARYGTDLWLPEAGSAGFDGLWKDVRSRLRAVEGCETTADPADADSVREIVRDIQDSAPTIEDLATLGGGIGTLKAILWGHDLGRIIQSHSPELHFCWLQAIDPSQLTITN